jgi:RNA polymerase sigma-70 factor, ECF subfamily
MYKCRTSLPSLMSTIVAELFERHAETVYRFLLRETASPALGEDLTQDVFLRVIEGHRRYEARGLDASWLFRIAHNVLVDFRQTRRLEMLRLGDVREPAHDPGNIAALVYADALRFLAPGDRAVYLLREKAGLSYAELARMFEITEEGVRSRLYRARRDLRRLLSDGRLYDREDHRGR